MFLFPDREPSPKLTNADSLTKYKYEEEINTLIKTSMALDTTNVEDCLLGKGLGFYIPETTRFVCMRVDGCMYACMRVCVCVFIMTVLVMKLCFGALN